MSEARGLANLGKHERRRRRRRRRRFISMLNITSEAKMPDL
jgi:hypothetical protein